MQNRQAIAKWAAAPLLTIAVLYPLSYAPLSKLRPDGITAMGAYKPIDWLIDNTQLQKPLFLWARVWEVEEEFVLSYMVRKIELRINPSSSELIECPAIP